MPYTTLWCKGEDDVEVFDDSLSPPPVTEPGYIYDVPADPLELPPRTTTSLPVYEYEVVTANPADFQPLPEVQDIPADLADAINAAIRKAVEAELQNALMLQKATEDMQRLRAGLLEAVKEAVRRVVTQSIREQTASQQASSSADLEAALTQAVRQAVTKAVEERLRPGMVMNTVMKLEMEDIAAGVRRAVIEAIRQRLVQAVTTEVPEVNIVTKDAAPSVASVRAAVGEAIRRVVTAAVEARSRGMSEARRAAINTGLQSAVSASLDRELGTAGDGTSLEDIRFAVEVSVMEAVR